MTVNQSFGGQTPGMQCHIASAHQCTRSSLLNCNDTMEPINCTGWWLVFTEDVFPNPYVSGINVGRRPRIQQKFFPQITLHCQTTVKGVVVMKRVAEYTAVDDNGAPLKKHDDDPDTRIAHIRHVIVVEQQAITALHSSIATLHIDLDKRQQRLATLERELDDAYKAKEMVLQKEREEFELSIQRITTTVTTERIKLDVGGRIFSVTLDMMLKNPDSFFARLFSGRWEDKKTEDGAYFINRDFDQFHHIVSFLRNGCLDVSLSEDDHRALCREADFYQLNELVDVLKPSVSVDDWTWTETPKGLLSNGGLTLTGKKGDRAALCGTIGWTHSVHEWVVRNDAGNFIFVGISLENIDPNDWNSEISYRLDCYNGIVYGPNNYNQSYLTEVQLSGLPDGSLISVRLDMDMKTLTFGSNGKWNDKPAITDIPSNTWYPYVAMHGGSAATIVRA
jgi:hypothetical protein